MIASSCACSSASASKSASASAYAAYMSSSFACASNASPRPDSTSWRRFSPDRAAAPAAGSRCYARHRDCFALDVGVDSGHDFQQGRFAGAVQAQHADLGAREETKRNILQNLTFRRDDFAHAVHGIDVMGH